MNKTQKIIVTLLVVAILFSVMSILFTFSTNSTVGDGQVGESGNQGGNVALYISPQEGDVGGDNGSG